MRVIGLIGGIGSGKSTAAAMLAELGAQVVNADTVGHEVYRPGTVGFEAVVRAFGREIVSPAGDIDRRRLGAIVFAEKGRLTELNAIVHPLIRSAIEARIAAARAGGNLLAVVVEAAILLEAGWRDLVDEVWLVTAGSGRVVERLESQRGLQPSETQARMAQQMPDAARRAAADVVIENEGSLAELRAEIGRAWRERVEGRGRLS